MPKTDGDSDGNMDSETYEGNAHAADDLDMERRRIMARNRAKLIALGISVGVMELQDLAKQRVPTHARPRPSKPRADRHKPTEPTRRSGRLAATWSHLPGGSSGGGGGKEAEEGVKEPPLLLQLGEHGEAEVQGPAETARSRGGPGGPGGSWQEVAEEEEEEAGLTEEEIAAKAEQLRQREASRLRELELEGLVDFSPEVAVFVVIGSTGSHYTVRLSDAKRSCQCTDHRVRHRDCKHIRLILGKLQIQEDPSQWYQAVQRCFQSATAAAAAAEEEDELAERPSSPPPTAKTATAAAMTTATTMATTTEADAKPTKIRNPKTTSSKKQGREDKGAPQRRDAATSGADNANTARAANGEQPPPPPPGASATSPPVTAAAAAAEPQEEGMVTRGKRGGGGDGSGAASKQGGKRVRHEPVTVPAPAVRMRRSSNTRRGGSGSADSPGEGK